ncbi:MAG: D-hexose-6-phosphate mutarotase [Azonexus sp.]|nr:D-hexose-6-phosphate mutarotase [Azonexus sp.]
MKPSIETIEFRGTPALRLNGPGGSVAVVSLLGGQLLSWITPDGRERLYLSPDAVFDGSRPIRGGVPICFPQFADLGDLPKHGLVRTRQWAVGTQRSGDDYALVTLTLSDDAQTRAAWPHAFALEMTVMLEADRVDMELCVQNTGIAAFSFTAALHTYVRCVQVEDVAIEGFYGHDYRDATRDNAVVRDSGTELTVDREIDRVYRNVKRPQWLRAGNLSLGIQQQGFGDVVVWNPWAEKCAALADMPDEDWRYMLCIEAAAADTAIDLTAGDEWYGRQTLVAI